MSDEEETNFLSFHEMGLDDRLLKAISKLGWSVPTPIQEKAIPLALEGKDILARAKTGSGKTAAFAIPIIQKILMSKQTATEQCVKAILMTPTKELCHQAYKNVLELTSSCSREVRCIDVSPQVPLASQRPMLAEKPDIVVGTPSRLLSHIQAGNLDVKTSLEMIVIDEADLVFSFGYENNVRALLSHMPKIYQAFLMSATLGDDVKALKKMVLHNAVILKLDETKLPEQSQLTHYHLKCEEGDKFALLYALLKLKLVRGKTIIFVNSVDKCYKVKLFLEQFVIPACVLNSELPVTSRCHIISQFNDGMYDIIVASDEFMLGAPDGESKESGKRKRDSESGVSRGLDFQNVSNIINFDFPGNVESYIHRVGRTARGYNKGTALSFVAVKEMPLLEKVEKQLAGTEDHPGAEFKPFQFRMEEIEGFRYRARDAMSAVTRVAIREARFKEIKSELLASKVLKTHFEDNPRDLQILRHDKALHTIKKQAHMKNVPDYMVPPTLKRLSRRQDKKKPKDEKPRLGPRSGKRKFKKRNADPLKSFKYSTNRQQRGKRKQKPKPGPTE